MFFHQMFKHYSQYGFATGHPHNPMACLRVPMKWAFNFKYLHFKHTHSPIPYLCIKSTKHIFQSDVKYPQNAKQLCIYIYICDYIWLQLCNKTTYLAGKRISILLNISKYCNIWYLAVTFEVSIHSQLYPKLLTHEIPKRRTCQSPLDYRD